MILLGQVIFYLHVQKTCSLKYYFVNINKHERSFRQINFQLNQKQFMNHIKSV